MIIGICGLIGSGKGSIAEILINEHGYKQLSFANKLKDAVAIIFGWNRELLEGVTDESRKWRESRDEFWSNEIGKDITPRYVLQKLGTDCLRESFYTGIWTGGIKKEISENPNINWVISDVRFPDEIKMISDIGGKLWHVRRGELPSWYDIAIQHNNGTLKNKDDINKINVHISEWAWISQDEIYDEIIFNDKDLSNLENEVRKILINY